MAPEPSRERPGPYDSVSIVFCMLMRASEDVDTGGMDGYAIIRLNRAELSGGSPLRHPERRWVGVRERKDLGDEK